MKRAILAGLLYGIGAGAACYLGYLFGYQEAELKNERALARAAISTLNELGSKKKETTSEEEAPHE